MIGESKTEQIRVIGAGWGRTGTSSFKKALEILKFGKCYHMNENFDNGHANQWIQVSDFHDLKVLDSILIGNGYRSTCDFPSAVYYKLQMQLYPDAKVILTYRDPEVWYKSFMNTIGNMQPDNEKCPFGVRVAFAMGLPCKNAASMLNKVITRDCFHSDWSKENIIKSYNDHIEDVKRFVPPEKLLIYSVAEGWEPLCNFLNCDVPNVKFPNENSTKEFQSLVRMINAVGYAISIIGMGIPALYRQQSLIGVNTSKKTVKSSSYMVTGLLVVGSAVAASIYFRGPQNFMKLF